ncbi:hypothetical protein JCM19233_815 [Vibrio astriarenae]|nr:hypothetical protein JCM19233_815 [Vibrio sp. C7]
MTTSYFQLTHEYDIGERSLYFSLSHEALSALPCSPIELAVYLQFKAEALYDTGVTLDHETQRRFFSALWGDTL